jgi:hypothetical protein
LSECAGRNASEAEQASIEVPWTPTRGERHRLRRAPLRVAHAGREAALSPASPTSTALQGTSLGGFWEMRSPLSAEELAAPAKRPMQLGIVATLRCKGVWRQSR